MARYIDADLLLQKAIEEKRFFISYENAVKRGYDVKTIYGDLAEFIDNQPTADVAEVKCRCSECKHLKIINKEPVYAECERQKLTFLLWEADTREHSCSHGVKR